MAIVEGARLDHIARESSDIVRLANFYKEVFGFEETEAPKFAGIKAIWLNLPQSFTLHLIERNPSFKLPEGPYSATSAVLDPAHITRGHHVSFSVPNFDSFVQVLQESGIETCRTTRPDGKVRQVFLFDPDGNGLEVASRDE